MGARRRCRSAGSPSPPLPAGVGIKTDSGAGTGRAGGEGGRESAESFLRSPRAAAQQQRCPCCAERWGWAGAAGLRASESGAGPGSEPPARPGLSSPLLRAARRKHPGQGRESGAGRSAGRGSGTAGTAAAGRARGER